MNARTRSVPNAAARAPMPDTPEVDRAERKVAAVLDDLEAETRGEVRDIDLEDLVDTDEHGKPIIRKAVDIDLQQPVARHWSRS